MSLKAIQLPRYVIATLYPDALVAGTAMVKTEEPKPAPAQQFLGSNQKNILIVAESHEAVILGDEKLSFLVKLLEACKMNLGDVAIVNHAVAPLTIGRLKEEFHPRALLLFGVSPRSLEMPIEFPMFKLQEHDGCTYLCVPPLEELDTETHEAKILKSKLWLCLKKLFEITR